MPDALSIALEKTDFSDTPHTEEIQGVYGTFTFPEKLLQKIWLRREFNDTALKTLCGKRVEILSVGRWNHFGGPDFLESCLRIDGREFRTAVELHLRAKDWDAHAHARDPAYKDVGLHVVLFPPPPGLRSTRGVGGQEIPILVLLPWLLFDLEEYTAETAIENLAGRPTTQLRLWMGALSAEHAGDELRGRSSQRWQKKVRFARKRLHLLGWEAACHHTALEILGYRFNRAPMLKSAVQFPLSDWAARPAKTAAESFETHHAHWVRTGVRPANQPRHRLQQYASWVQASPKWPHCWAECIAKWLASTQSASPGFDNRAGLVRREHALPKLRETIQTAVCGNALSGSRLDTLVCDGLLPLWAARSDEDLEWLWYVWYPGDQPAEFARQLKRLKLIDGPTRPACHGLMQGLLGWLIERAEA